MATVFRVLFVALLLLGPSFLCGNQTLPWKAAVEAGVLTLHEQGSDNALLREPCAGQAGEVKLSRHGRFLFVAAMDRDSVASLCALVFDTVGKKVLARLRPLDNPSVLSLSPDGQHLLVDSGTAASRRKLTVLSLRTGQERGHYLYNDSRKPVWVSSMAFAFYDEAGPKVAGKPDLSAATGSKPNTYLQKKLWKDGKVQAQRHYLAAYAE